MAIVHIFEPMTVSTKKKKKVNHDGKIEKVESSPSELKNRTT